MACRSCGRFPFCERSKGPCDTCENEVPRRDKSGEAIVKDE